MEISILLVIVLVRNKFFVDVLLSVKEKKISFCALPACAWKKKIKFNLL